MTGTHEDDTAIPVQPGSKRARVSTDTSTATPEKKDLLTELFDRMRPYCKPGTFVYNVLMTIFRHVLIMNKVYEYGRNVWHGNPEGEDVLRFWIVYGTIVGTSAIDLLRGGAIAKRAKRFLPGVPEIFDGGLQNLPGVPGPRQVHYYSATPYPLKDIVSVSALMVDAALEALGGPEGLGCSRTSRAFRTPSSSPRSSLAASHRPRRNSCAQLIEKAARGRQCWI